MKNRSSRDLISEVGCGLHTFGSETKRNKSEEYLRYAMCAKHMSCIEWAGEIMY